ncbi:STPG4-like protein, partial [Mya arenaria]
LRSGLILAADIEGMKPRATMITTPSKAYSMPTRKHRAKTESSLTVQRHPWEPSYMERLSDSSYPEYFLPGIYDFRAARQTTLRVACLSIGPEGAERGVRGRAVGQGGLVADIHPDGRRIDPHPHGKGAMLLPGAYEHKDFLTRLERDPATYGFKTAERDKFDVLNFGRKDKRDGPAPGNYEYQPELPPKVSSCFKSKTPRFSSSHTRVPGPGSYEKTFQTAQNGVLQKMGRQHGLFFSSAFQV